MKNKHKETQMPKDDKSKMQLEFAPGCFDNFEGTQEELDEMVAEITRMFESGEMMEHAYSLEDEDLSDEDWEKLRDLFGDEPGAPSTPRRLN